MSARRCRIGILDHTPPGLGGAQLVAAYAAHCLAREFEVEIIHSGPPGYNQRMVRAFHLDLARVRERRLPETEPSFNLPGPAWVGRQLWRNRPELTRRYDLFFYSGHGFPPFCFARTGVVYVHFPMELMPALAFATDEQWKRRSVASRRLRLALYEQLWRFRMRRYRRILTNSQFTARWIRRYWGLDAEVLAPPVELHCPVAEKENAIVSVGRFVGRARKKNQLEQVAAFNQFLRQVGSDWKLVLAGSCGDEEEDVRYLQQVRAAAAGLPVEFRLNESRDEVCRALRRAKLFWHTVGLELDEESLPAYAEHFGIATVESMAAGCVPIVIPSGGQREIITDGENGFLAETLDALVERSVTLSQNSEHWSRLSAAAIRRSRDFSADVFAKRLRAIVSECQAPPGTPPSAETAEQV